MNDSQSVKGKRGVDPEKRRRFLEIARRRFVADGYNRTSISSIVREAGVAQGTFYLYFKNKEALLNDLRRQVLADYLDVWARATGTDRAADERLLDGLHGLWGEYGRQQSLISVFRQAATGEETERQLRAGRRRLAQPLAALIAAGVSDGVFVVDEPETAARMLIAMLYGIFPESDLDRVFPNVARVVLRALGTPAGRIDALMPAVGASDAAD
ncbi:MAG: TetR/AcrR family transcriptional regulator [Myxococcota bacterium]